MTGECLACRKHTVLESCHVRARGAGGPNDAYNIIYMCHASHQAQHRWGWRKFLDKYPCVKEELESRGWVIEDVLGRLRMWHARLNEI